MGGKIGIDLGTTNSVAAILDGPRPRVLDSRESRPQTRSVVSIRNGEILVGDVALNNRRMAPQDTIVSIKRLMGRAVADPEVQRIQKWADYEIIAPTNGNQNSLRVRMGGKEYSPPDISAMILAKIREDAEYRLNSRVTHAVITVPAYFSQRQKAATREAAEKAGLRVIKILDEPTAAAIAFGVESNTETPQILLVYDFGGGTFDISLLLVHKNVYAPLNKEGDMWLGGDNLDQLIVDHVLEYCKTEFGTLPTPGTKDTRRFMAELRKAAQEAKETLSSSTSTNVAASFFDSNGNIIDLDVDVSRTQFEQMILPFVGRYRECRCGKVYHKETVYCQEPHCRQQLRQNSCSDEAYIELLRRSPERARELDIMPLKNGRAIEVVLRALDTAKFTTNEVDRVLLAGNSSSVPLVQKELADLFEEQKILRSVHPKHAVAIGAAVLAARTDGLFCQAPVQSDPDTPENECGHLNQPDALKCAACGAPLVPVEDADHHDTVSPGNTSELYYGIEVAGDQIEKFIDKNEKCPTPSPKTRVRKTQVPNQPMVSIPVWGAGTEDDLATAGRRDLQGHAFAILPHGLPQGTPILITLRLDEDGIFSLRAEIQDGPPLDPWIMHGEADAAAIDHIEKVDVIIANGRGKLSREKLEQLEAGRQGVFELLRVHRFDDALELAKALVSDAERPETLQERAERLCGFTEEVLADFSWLLDSAKKEDLERRVAEIRAILSSPGMRQGDGLSAGVDRLLLEQRISELDRATDDLPAPVWFIRRSSREIDETIRPGDPVAADQLLQELRAIVHQGGRDPVGAIQRLMEFSQQRLAPALARASRQPVSQLTCPTCSVPMRVGDRYCSNRHDSWLTR